MTKLIQIIALTLTVSIAFGASSLVVNGVQAEEASKEVRKTRKTPALNARVYEQLARAQTEADEGRIAEAIEVLDRVKAKSRSLNSYEMAMLYNFYGFIYYNAEDYDKAIQSFAQVVEQQPIPERFEQSTLMSLAQLNLMRGNYQQAIDYLDRWETLIIEGTVPAKNYYLKAQAYYQDKQYAIADEMVSKAVQLVEAEGEVPQEGWFILQRAIYYELQQPAKVKDVLVKLVRHYNDGKYWVQLAGMYGELGQEKAQYAIMEAAVQQGFITAGQDMFNMAQLYYYHRAPIKCAELMESAFADEKLEKDLRNLRFLGSCLQLAKEYEAAIPVMQAAAELSEDGELYANLAQTFLNLDQHAQAIEHAQLALAKGDLSNEGNMYLVLAMAKFNQKQFDASLTYLDKAADYKKSKRIATNWKKFVEGEKRSYQATQEILNNI